MRAPVSALLPVRNGEKWIQGTIDNLNRTLSCHDEIIIVDDNSTDRTVEILKSAKFKCSTKIVLNKSKGLVSALNLGILESTNLWIARFDVDDYYLDQRIDIQMSSIDENIVAIFSDYEIFSEEGEYLGYIPSPITHLATYISLLNSQRTPHPSVIFRKDAVSQVGGYIESDFPCEDLSLWLRLAKVGKLAGAPYPLLQYGLRKTSISGSRYIEAKRKTIDVTNRYFDYGIKLDLISVKDSIFIYNNVSHSLERRLLLIRDIVKLNRKSRVSFALKLFLIRESLFLFANYKTIARSVRQLRYRAKRRKYRSF
jgi:glycosyltransferase involved in cell wall biosynthesis